MAKYYPLGAEFEMEAGLGKTVTVKVVESTGCENCMVGLIHGDFREDDRCCKKFACLSTEREDHTSVAFVSKEEYEQENQ